MKPLNVLTTQITYILFVQNAMAIASSRHPPANMGTMQPSTLENETTPEDDLLVPGGGLAGCSADAQCFATAETRSDEAAAHAVPSSASL